uniref:Uncharacterized protein n=1 Tax=Rhizophagus irregularis (strain DAOM 181602 / DAOM 197198 / MUCL 43194) TaxID=747089 RepID=U9U2M2_RHIID
MGYLEHSESCKRAIRVLPPVLNLHPCVKEMALNLLKLMLKFIEQKYQIFGNDGNLVLKEAYFHYQPETINNRLEIGISTKAQRNLAWSFGHKNILLLGNRNR